MLFILDLKLCVCGFPGQRLHCSITPFSPWNHGDIVPGAKQNNKWYLKKKRRKKNSALNCIHCSALHFTALFCSSKGLVYKFDVKRFDVWTSSSINFAKIVHLWKPVLSDKIFTLFEWISLIQPLHSIARLDICLEFWRA